MDFYFERLYNMKQIKEVYVKDRNFPDDIYLSTTEIKYDD